MARNHQPVVCFMLRVGGAVNFHSLMTGSSLEHLFENQRFD